MLHGIQGQERSTVYRAEPSAQSYRLYMRLCCSDATATAARIAQQRLAERDWETDELARQQREVRNIGVMHRCAALMRTQPLCLTLRLLIVIAARIGMNYSCSEPHL